MEQKINWYRTPVKKDLLKQLTIRSDFRGLLQAGSFFFIYLASVYFSYYFFAQRLWIPMIVVCYLYFMFSSFVGMEASVHELSHGTPFKSRWVNELFYYLFCFLTWNNPIHFRVSHMKHHQYTVHKGLDKEVVLAPIRLTVLDYISWFTFDFKKFKMIVFPNIAHFFGNADADFFFWDPLFPGGDKRRKKLCNWARFVVIGHLILLGVFIYFQLWVFIFVVTFGYFFATFLARGCEIQQHLGLCPNIPDWRVCCHTMIFGPLMGYLYWHMNYHTEHHMFAAVPFYNLRELHESMAFDTPEPPKGYLAGLKKILSIQRQQRLKSDYCFMPEFPSNATPPRIPT